MISTILFAEPEKVSYSTVSLCLCVYEYVRTLFLRFTKLRMEFHRLEIFLLL